ncbi:MAG: bifunctional methylenetetrahydrofolate dehydrogenase/methenyltetrahydrofolate cyclohydrolase FolD [Rhodospirillaceae bacterium]|jgi:methylenetetrahydrofolate dehydrogenase (NADP+) / methenyltetrahydrofolate cyclohydrolase|nr:bifunctional methylenetetrahydrofolate dehydrogenase/methenyltetrahydrofolate cyclohydrolase FolD [Rhodospirillaceae bacterium]MBT4219640.1 bifunctional methylenetetrahydrofolate dehydrogenase/methenyltetrahydrofolate cyclohydrolase FolD [Rhodospirillaceae bacterium]MBT5014593.1 bifunctional methylenetetrahydrofolate dehydrogenase/methenyltetrahydrofolate cyclohydrolase FolD [Rhodospirillaceae bacterium]MBT5309114.1 bifunctional methylenetetrahydrofolate dehydrogenase/methenyltetrahydrofolate
MADAKIIDGKAFAEGLRNKVAQEVARLKDAHEHVPGLAVVLIGEDPASQVYVRNKGKQTIDAGMNSFEHKLSDEITNDELLTLIHGLNKDDKVNGILVQLPLPDHIDEARVLAAIDPAKDVDGFHVINVGKLATGDSSAMVPCTPLGCLMMLKDTLGDLTGKTALVLGRSNIVGKPMAQLLLGEHCTVTIAHSRTKDLPDVCRNADILIAAVGRPHMVKGDWIKPGAVVVDVGINRIDAPEKGEGKTRLVGDVDFDAASQVASAITPVPGGVGPMTIACLLRNTLVATCLQNDLDIPEI